MGSNGFQHVCFLGESYAIIANMAMPVCVFETQTRGHDRAACIMFLDASLTYLWSNAERCFISVLIGATLSKYSEGGETKQTS